MENQNVGIIGSGVMGRGIAQAFAQTGHKVILYDISQKQLDGAKNEIKNNLRLRSLFYKCNVDRNGKSSLSLITFTTNIRLLSTVKYAIENVPEKIEIKRELFLKLDRICPKNSIIATDTSTIPISKIAEWTNRPSKIIGTHFMNPAHLTGMVEVIRGEETSDETVERTKNLINQIGKDFIVVNDSPGFVSNRVLMLMINEAIFLLHEKVASAEEIDKIFKTCFGHKMGPLETADLIGLDTVFYSLQALNKYFNNNKFSPCPLLKEMVNTGLNGQKSGKGFYQYPVNE